ncbi:MAG: thiamine diphosphokinase [Patescibacteria group bacterium]|nr:thiamine diphosphokinase [Patescibacteria group bacterium]
MKTIIIANGNLDHQEINWGEYDFIVATDGGANQCMNLNIRPDLIIGDFDSISEKALEVFKNVKQIKIEDQNKTDLEKAIDYLGGRGHIIIDVCGATSCDRVDHTLANIFLLKQYPDLKIKIISRNNIIEIVNNKILKNMKSAEVSIFPIKNNSEISLKGFKWNEIENYSVSNLITEDIAEIKSDKKFILIINKKA